MPCAPKKVCEGCNPCETIPGLIAIRDALLKDKLSQLKKERKIAHSDLVVGMLMRTADDALGRGDERAAKAAAEKAILFSERSPLPHFFLSRLYPLTDKESLGEYVTAIRLSAGNFWLLTSSIGIIGLALMIAFHLCLVTFLLYCFVHYIPLWIHYFRERLPAAVHNGSILLVIVLFLFVFFFLLPPFWSLFISLFFFCFFYRQKEKGVAIAFLVGLIVFSFLLKPILLLLTAKQSVLLSQMVTNQEGNFMGAAPSFDPSEIDWKVPFIKAAYETQENDLGEAETLYKQALLKNPDNKKRILNNLGNIAFYRNNFEEAMAYYQKAIGQDQNYVASHYNMGQVHNEMFAFDKGQNKYIEAKKINQALTEYYAQSASKYPNHPVIEERFTQLELWRQLFLLSWNSSEENNDIMAFWVGGLPWIPFLALIILIGVGGWFTCRKLKEYVHVEFCPICKKAMCIQCQESLTNYNVCGACNTDMMTGVSKKQGNIPSRMTPFFIVPGGGQLTMQKPVLALCFLMPFYFSITLMAVGDVFLTSAHWHLSIAKSPLFPMTILFLYGSYFLDIYLKRER